MRTLLLLALALSACSDAPAQQVPPGTDPARARFEQVSAALMAGDYHLEGDWAGSALDEIEHYYEATRDPEVIELALRFAARWPREAPGAVSTLANVRADTLGSLVEAPPAWWGQGEWYALAANLIGECREAEGCWRDERVVEALLERTLAAETDVGARDRYAEAFAALATLSEAQALARLVEAPPDRRLVPALYGALARYDTPELTRLVRTRLRSGDLEMTWWMAEVSFGPLARHDLLPELRALLERARQTDDASDFDAAYVRAEFPALLEELERAREAGVAPGLPLDWPATPDDYEAPR